MLPLLPSTRTSSPAAKDQETTDCSSQLAPRASLAGLPTELHLLIAKHLIYPDALSLKHTSRHFFYLVDTGVKLKVDWLMERWSLHLECPNDRHCDLRSDLRFCRGSVKYVARRSYPYVQFSHTSSSADQMQIVDAAAPGTSRVRVAARSRLPHLRDEGLRPPAKPGTAVPELAPVTSDDRTLVVSACDAPHLSGVCLDDGTGNLAALTMPKRCPRQPQLGYLVRPVLRMKFHSKRMKATASLWIVDGGDAKFGNELEFPVGEFCTILHDILAIHLINNGLRRNRIASIKSARFPSR
ncbi:hypothetical protein CIB48_g4899 [Xylaria polymorpha]|nr:hypothetical protein CIB48_g4899 [Xylaria polymorpha]